MCNYFQNLNICGVKLINKLEKSGGSKGGWVGVKAVLKIVYKGETYYYFPLSIVVE